jgi:hypothetical protein
MRRQKQRPDPLNPSPIGDGGNLVNYVRDSINPPAGSGNLQLPQQASLIQGLIAKSVKGIVLPGAKSVKLAPGKRGPGFRPYKDV